MIQFSKIWSASLALAAMFVATGAQAQYNSFNTSPDTAIRVSDGVLGIYMESPAPVVWGDIQWSRNTSSMYAITQLTGSYFDQTVDTTTTSSSGSILHFQQFVKALAPSTFTVESNGKLGNGALFNPLTWTSAGNEDVGFSGGSFILSNLHWNLLTDGSAQLLATASGTGIATTDLVAFTTPAAAVTNADGLLTFSKLSLSESAFALWTEALGADPAGLGYSALRGAGSSIGSLHVGVTAVPEPATWLQMGLGLVGLGALLRRRQG